MINRVLEVHINEIKNNIKNQKFKRTLVYECNYDLLGISDDLSKKDKYQIIQQLINYYLLNIKKLHPKVNLNYLKFKYNKYLEYFVFDESKNISKKDQEKIIIAVNYVIHELYYKSIDANGRVLTLPIKIEDLEEHFIPVSVKKQYIIDALILVVVHLAIVYNDLKDMP